MLRLTSDKTALDVLFFLTRNEYKGLEIHDTYSTILAIKTKMPKSRF